MVTYFDYMTMVIVCKSIHIEKDTYFQLLPYGPSLRAIGVTYNSEVESATKYSLSEQVVQTKKCVFFTIHCNPSLACVTVRDFQSSPTQCECTVTPIGW